MTEIPVIFIDEDIMVVNKPAGITVIPDRIHTDRETIQSILQKQFGRLWVVHRIDRFTSGVLCFARNETAHKHLSLQFQNHQVQKFYKAVVAGRMLERSGTVNQPIAENMARPGTMLIHRRGKEAVSIYEVEESFKHATLLNVEIKTGRTHQIRVHLAFLGNPLLVDDLYGKADAFYFSAIKRNYKPSREEERPTIARLTLHAFKVVLNHPASGELMSFTAPLPKDLETLLKLLRKYDS
ncbi:MAG: RluA family pseudouridine synthase [Chitinophagales bacterium]